ncbi:dihydroneopterin aldolase/dihydroneopterin aldolase / 2-amino-4-hydroxy-6-hydroxymethyldihydropteridine diphosphokinase [Microbacterium sp. LKL04]|uniref:dihydroneopterin aldolase n=1 Tax=unclassified Microbacterium TaxID=2609290 RepID=UPI000875E65E|nr:MULTISPECIES: dihydroneopterin aldolase [unclassified Microbacterium]MDQ1126245.1 dihydroneopterin aldolase [Microbacterium sp. SORGH_AS_0505]SCY64047.1 dihydroneopterin aldolase/dihydroneopterin aldolase / 2-amino-4-hydroxy-6-hydroxymethyldihydropteridine diphosphokinase [Microbacterium sp. LKL04]
MMTDEIAITGIRATGYHGVYEHERRDGQEFVADLVLSLSLARAAATDDVTDTVHYGEVAERVAAILAGDPVDLIETVAERIATAVLSGWSLVDAVAVTVHKPSAPIPVPFGDVAVTVRRSRA